MDFRTPNAVAAAFPNRVRASACASDLEASGFARPWIAVTRPAPPAAEGGGATDRRALNDVTETSDGALGVIGRFFTGEGRSLRRSLEDHGLDPDVAAAVDEALTAPATVLVVDADARREAALAIIRTHGGATELPLPLGATDTPDDIDVLETLPTGFEPVPAAFEPITASRPNERIGDEAVKRLEDEEDAFYARRPPKADSQGSSAR